MNSKNLIVLIPAWVCTLGLAYWLGSSGDTTPDSNLTAPGPFRSGNTPSANNTRSAYIAEGENTSTPLDAIRHLVARPEETGRWIGIDETLANLRPSEAREALSWVSQLPPGPKRDSMMLGLIKSWATLDPQAAMSYLNNVSSLRLREQATSDVLEAWGRTQPAAAMAWLNQNAAGTPSRTLNQRVLAVIEGYAQNDPGGAFHYASSLPEDTAAQRELKTRAMRDIMREMVNQEKVGDALNLVANLPNDNSRNNAFGDLIQQWAQYDPQAAAQHIHYLGDDASGEAKRALMRSWAQYDPSSAAAWLSTLPPNDPEIGNLVTSLVNNWARYDLEAPAAWLNQIPPSPEIDRAVAVYTMRTAQEDPAGAMSWAESITREETRNRLMSRVAAEWRQQDPQAFQKYIESAQLSEEQKARMLNARPGGPAGARWWGRD